MKIKNISFPYPVLGIGDDIMPMPSMNVTQSADRFKYTFDIDFVMENADIQRYVDEGYAEYTCEVDCQKTNFRISYKSKTPHLHIELNRQEVMGEVRFFNTIALLKPIYGYSNKQSHEDYKGFAIDLGLGDILAYLGEFTYDAEIKYDKLHAISSFMEIKELASLETPRFDLTGDKIMILLPTKLFKTYKEKIRGPKFANVIHASLVFNALMYALYNYDAYADRIWARTLAYRVDSEANLKRFHLNDPTDVPNLANELLGNPYERLFDNLVTMTNDGE